MVFREILPVQMGNPENIFSCVREIPEKYFSRTRNFRIIRVAGKKNSVNCLLMHKRNQGNIFFACEKIQKLFFKKSERHALAKLELSQFPKFP